jgi:two-component system OmpR family sensor kinase
VTGRVARLRARTPLRIQLVASLLALLAVALLVTGFATTVVLRDYLLHRVDDQLRGAARPITAGVVGGFMAPAPGPGQGLGGYRLPGEVYAELQDADGETVRSLRRPLAGDQPRPAVPPIDVAEAVERGGRPFSVPGRGAGDSEWRVIVVPLADPSGSVVIAQSLADIEGTAARLVGIELVLGALVLTVLAGVGYAAVRSSLRPLEQMESTAEAIAAGDLSQRVPEQDPRTEVGRLGGALNGMLAQIESAFRSRAASETRARQSEDRMRRFVADASHELRTPLTSIRGFAELYRQGAAPDPGDVARAMRRIEDEATRMGLLVEDLLLLARLDQQRQLERRPVDLLTLAVDAVHDARAIHPARRIDLDVRPAADDQPAPVVLGDEPRLRQVVSNLVGNALMHTPDGTLVAVRVRTARENGAGWAVLEVADSGPGLAPEEAERVFERFYRADPSRARTEGGTGIGLSIVAALVTAHGGTVDVESAPGHGATFRVRLPLEHSQPLPR